MSRFCFMMFGISVCGFGFLSGATIAVGETVVFRQGISNPFVTNYEGTEDGTLMAGFNTENIGARTTGFVGYGYAFDFNKMLMRFDLTSMAAAAADPDFQITGVTLTLYGNDFELSSGTVDLHEVTLANKDWVPGTGESPKSSVDGSSTWLFMNQDTWENGGEGTPWAGSEGMETPDTDYVSTPLASVTLTGSEPRYSSQAQFAITDFGLIDEWIAGNNAGLLIRSPNMTSQQVVFWTSEASAGVRPSLTIDYTLGAAVDNADFDGDGDVDGRDFLIWQRGFGSGNSLAQGDANGSGSVDGEDLVIWQTQYGNPAPLGAISSIPEPSALVMQLIAVGSFIARRTKKS